MPFVLTTGQRHESTPFERLTERGPSGGQARSSQLPVPSTIWIRRSGRCWAMGHAKKLTQKPVWSRTPTLRTYEQQVGASRGYTKPRRLSGCLVTVVGRKPLRGCRCVGYQIEARLPEATLGKATAAQARAWEDSKGTRDLVEASLKLPGDASYRGVQLRIYGCRQSLV